MFWRMLLIPIGHEQESTRRAPWVTFGLMIACVVAFLATGFGGSRSEWDSIASYQKAIDYWMERPYLRLDPQVERAMHGVATGGKIEAFREGLRTNVDKPDAETLRDEQAELDRRCAEATQSPIGGPFEHWGLVPAHMSPVTLLTHMFLHAGWLHLLGNLLILYLAGPFIEDVWGRPIFAGFYALSGIVAALAFVIPHADSTEPMIGASGAIAGVMGAFAVRYWTTKIQFVYVVGLGWARGSFWAPSWLMLGLWFGQQVLFSLLTAHTSVAGGGGVAYLAHIGGFAFGAAVAVAFQRYEIERRWIAPSIDRTVEKVLVSNPGVDAALELAARGDVEGAWQHLLAEVVRAPEDLDVVMALWGFAQAHERSREAAPAMAGLIQADLQRGAMDSAVEHWNELREHVPSATLDVRSLIKLAGFLACRYETDRAVDLLRRAMLALSKKPDAALAAKIAELAREREPKVARMAAQLALGQPGLDSETRKRVEAVLARP
jgi:membrane associated rhomboid family serine protease